MSALHFCDVTAHDETDLLSPYLHVASYLHAGRHQIPGTAEVWGKGLLSQTCRITLPHTQALSCGRENEPVHETRISCLTVKFFGIDISYCFWDINCRAK